MSSDQKTMVRVRPDTRATADEIAALKEWTLAETFAQGIKLLKKQVNKPRRRSPAA